MRSAARQSHDNHPTNSSFDRATYLFAKLARALLIAHKAPNTPTHGTIGRRRTASPRPLGQYAMLFLHAAVWHAPRQHTRWDSICRVFGRVLALGRLPHGHKYNQ